MYLPNCWLVSKSHHHPPQHHLPGTGLSPISPRPLLRAPNGWSRGCSRRGQRRAHLKKGRGRKEAREEKKEKPGGRGAVQWQSPGVGAGRHLVPGGRIFTRVLRPRRGRGSGGGGEKSSERRAGREVPAAAGAAEPNTGGDGGGGTRRARAAPSGLRCGAAWRGGGAGPRRPRPRPPGAAALGWEEGPVRRRGRRRWCTRGRNCRWPTAPRHWATPSSCSCPAARSSWARTRSSGASSAASSTSSPRTSCAARTSTATPLAGHSSPSPRGAPPPAARRAGRPRARRPGGGAAEPGRQPLAGGSCRRPRRRSPRRAARSSPRTRNPASGAAPWRRSGGRPPRRWPSSPPSASAATCGASAAWRRHGVERAKSCEWTWNPWWGSAASRCPGHDARTASPSQTGTELPPGGMDKCQSSVYRSGQDPVPLRTLRAKKLPDGVPGPAAPPSGTPGQVRPPPPPSAGQQRRPRDPRGRAVCFRTRDWDVSRTEGADPFSPFGLYLTGLEVLRRSRYFFQRNLVSCLCNKARIYLLFTPPYPGLLPTPYPHFFLFNCHPSFWTIDRTCFVLLLHPFVLRVFWIPLVS